MFITYEQLAHYENLLAFAQLWERRLVPTPWCSCQEFINELWSILVSHHHDFKYVVSVIRGLVKIELVGLVVDYVVPTM